MIIICLIIKVVISYSPLNFVLLFVPTILNSILIALKNISFPVLVFGLCVQLNSALYPSGSDVIELTDTNFNSKVIDSVNVWVVEYFAPWCGHCQKFAAEYSKAASALKGVAKVGAIDCDKYKSSFPCSDISGYPSIKIFSDKKKPTPYNGQRTAKGVADAAVDGIRQKVNAGLGIGGGDSKSDSKDVIELTDSNFDELVLNSKDMWLVEFYAPWCGHCKSLAPEYADAASKLKGKVKLGALDATVHTSKAAKYNIKGYPTIKYFPAGKKSDAEEYDGGRTSDALVAWSLDKYTLSLPPPEVLQLVNTDILKNACEEHSLCVLSFLPHILDCQSECRNRYLSILKAVSERFKDKNWGWVWSEAAAHSELETVLEIGGFGYPAMALLNKKKMKYSVLKGSFSENGISEFLRDLSFGRGSTAAIKGASIPDVNSIEPWDGKDGILPVEDDYDLSDVDLNDLDESKTSKDEL